MVVNVLQKAMSAAWRMTQKVRQNNDVDVSTLAPFGLGGTGFDYSNFDGDKFPGGFGETRDHHVDYWTLRSRSVQLFNENLYARGLIRRLVTNEISTGLSLEAAPDESIIGLPADSLDGWSENVENRFGLWGKNAKVCDWYQSKTFGQLQEAARMEALIAGDVLVVLRFSKRLRLPMVQLISGSAVQTPLTDGGRLQKDHTINHGVEFDSNKRVVAHWVRKKDLSYDRVPAYGKKSGRKLSWLVFGTDKRLDDVRGQPILALVLQSLKEVDRYRDSVQRKAVINSMVAIFVKKTQDKMGTLPLTGGAVRNDHVSTVGGGQADSGQRNFNLTGHIPGIVMEELQHGEEPVGFNSNGIDLDFGVFEESIISAVAWANEIPPEILRLSFSSNYSASQAAINEFKIYLNKVWVRWGDAFCSPIYNEWVISEVLLNRMSAPGLLDAWRDLSKYDVYGAWLSADWYGSIKVSTDMLKQVKSSDLLVAGGYSTRSRESRVTTGLKFSKNIKRLKRENEQLAEVMRPILAAQAEFKQSGQQNVALGENDIESIVEGYIKEVV